MAERFGIVLLGLIGLIALLVPFLGLDDPLASDVSSALARPGARHWFGTDALGRDLFSRVLHAARLDLGLALAGVSLGLFFGTMLGALAGWLGGTLAHMSDWLVDLLLSLPIYLLGMALALGLGNSILVVVWATGLVNLPLFVRLTRIEVRRLGASLWVDAARMAGEGEGRILFRRILPKLWPLLVVQASTSLGWAALNAAGLSFIGLGVKPPQPEWGIMIAEGSRYLLAGQWWLVVFPGAALALTVFGFHMLGDALRQRLGGRG